MLFFFYSINQLDENLTKERLMAGTPDEERNKRKIQNLIQRKRERIDRFMQKIKEMKPELESLLIDLTSSKFSKDDKNQKLFDYKMSFDLTE